MVPARASAVAATTARVPPITTSSPGRQAESPPSPWRRPELPLFPLRRSEPPLLPGHGADHLPSTGHCRERHLLLRRRPECRPSPRGQPGRPPSPRPWPERPPLAAALNRPPSPAGRAESLPPPRRHYRACGPPAAPRPSRAPHDSCRLGARAGARESACRLRVSNLGRADFEPCSTVLGESGRVFRSNIIFC